MHVILPDGNRLDVPEHATGENIACAIGPGLARAALGIRIDGKLNDLLSEVPHGASIAIVTQRDIDSIELMRHTLAHVMAQAVTEYVTAQGEDPTSVRLGIGPIIAAGFYYDFDLPHKLNSEDLGAIEDRMRAIISADLNLERYSLPRAEALERYKLSGDPFKVDLIQNLPVDVPITFYCQGGERGFTDLCRGPHVPSTGRITTHFRLMSVAGAYWRGDEKNPMLQRIYGVAFREKEELEEHLWQLDEAKKRDHRKLGADLDIFVLDEDVGPGLPLWLPRGAILIEELEKLAKEVEEAAGYKRVRSPHLAKEQLFLKSGHLPYYRDDMYPPMELENVTYFLKPMNCPFHHKIFAARPKSYRDLPVRLAEYGTCYRYEDSGSLMGLMRVRSLQMNDAHIYCTEEEFEKEFLGVMRLYFQYFRLFGIDDYVMRFSRHATDGLGKKYVDNPGLWLKTEAMVRRAMEVGDINFVEVEDEAAFYGPKIDVQIKSAIGREFTLATNQVDFAQPDRFGLNYIDENNQKQIPICIHRAPLSTHERLVGFLIEHFAGDFPLWLAPEHVRLVPIADRHVGHAEVLRQRLGGAGIRSEVDSRSERMNAKIREAELYKVPYIAIIGDREVDEETISFRSRKEPNQNDLPFEKLVEHLRSAIESRILDIRPVN
jgi:threonyl-tRNA synthetase